MVKYNLTCKKCSLNEIYEVDSMDNLEEFWNNWNKEYGGTMGCMHDYEFKELN